MPRKNQEQVGLYVCYALILLLAYLLGDHRPVLQDAHLGLFRGCSLLQRLSYPFLHQSLWHAAVNLYVLWQCLGSVKAGWNLLIFYIIAVSYPFATDVPIVGLSGLVYAYMGYIAPYAKRKLRYNLIIAIYIGIGFLFPCMAVGVHIYCYVLGLLWGYLNAPLCKDE